MRGCLLLWVAMPYYLLWLSLSGKTTGDNHLLRTATISSSRKEDAVSLLKKGSRSLERQPTCSTPCNSDRRCEISSDGCPVCHKNKCVPIPTCNANCTISEDCKGASNNCSVCNPMNKQCVQPFPRCYMNCSINLDCSDGERTDNCSICNLVRRVCVSSLPTRGSYCFSDDHCAGARDGTSVCNLGQNRCVISLPHRGSSCSEDFDCRSATDGSYSCVNGICVPMATFVPNTKCST